MGKMPKIKSPESYKNFSEFFGEIRSLAQEYGELPVDRVFSAWSRASQATNPYVQNTRVKGIGTRPMDLGKDDISDLLKAPEGNESRLRAEGHALEYTAYPYFLVRKTLQDVNTYHYYTYPAYLTKEEAKSETFHREERLTDKLNHALRPDAQAHKIMGQALREGKVYYYPRYDVDKSHSNVNYAMLQQLPSDWVKIIGYNNVSGYTLSFNMMYFLQPGADWRQYGDLVKPYMDGFASIFSPTPEILPVADIGKKVVYASGSNYVKAADGRRLDVNWEQVQRVISDAPEGSKPEVYNQNGSWGYWVTLPVGDVWTFEIDDTSPVAVPTFTGLFLAFDQLAAYEAVQLQIVQNPLVSCLLGEIPYMKDNDGRTEDLYQLSGAGRTLFLTFWQQMLSENNTGGIGAYFAPVENMHIETLAEAPNATNISTSGYKYAISKAGLSGVIPTNEDPRAGSVTTTAKIVEAYGQCVYRQFERMMESIYKKLSLKHEWRFRMFGGFVTDSETEQNALKGMQSGIVSDTYIYLALHGRSVVSDAAMSRALLENDVMDLRTPLVTSFSGKPQTTEESKGGRPTKSATDVAEGNGTESQESDIDGNS